MKQTLTITYNSTQARYHPEFVDFYIQGIRQDNGFVDPYFLLQRSSYPADAVTLTFQTQVCPNLTLFCMS